MQFSLLLGEEHRGSNESCATKYTVPGAIQLPWAPTDSAPLILMGCVSLGSKAPAEHLQAFPITHSKMVYE